MFPNSSFLHSEHLRAVPSVGCQIGLTYHYVYVCSCRGRMGKPPFQPEWCSGPREQLASQRGILGEKECHSSGHVLLQGAFLQELLCPNILAAFSQLVKIIKSGPELFILISFTTQISTSQKNKSKTAGSCVKNGERGVYSVHPMLWLSANLKVALPQPRILMQHSPEQRGWKTLTEVGFCNLNYSMITLIACFPEPPAAGRH